MISRDITYIDYDGNEQTDRFYFHLSKADVWRLEIGMNGRFRNYIERLMEEKNQSEIWKIFEEIVQTSVGKKSIDGKRFDRSAEAKRDFLESEAYSEFIEILVTGDHGKNPNYASDFISGLVATAENPNKGETATGTPNLQLVTPAQ